MKTFFTSYLPLLFLLSLQFQTLASTNNERKKYYVSNDGKDSNTGAIDAPWKSLDKISNISLAAGDTVFFNRGDRFDGHFVVNGSGSQGTPIVITSYGDGDLPILSGEVGAENGGDFQEAILIENNDNITINGIEVNNNRLHNRQGVLEDDAFGILVLNSGTKVMRNFEVRNCNFKNIYAVKPILKDEGENAFNSIQVSGIRFFTTRNNIIGQEKYISNILVEDNYFTDIQRLGVHIKHDGGKAGVGNEMTNTNQEIIVRENHFFHTGGTCVLPIRTYNALIENNIFDHPGSNRDDRMPARGSAVWNWRCYNTVIQYNQCLSTRGYLDSHGIHVDHENVNTFIQYNYMEDCEGGFVEILGGNLNSVYRFNVSVNDGWRNNPGWNNSNHTIWINNKVPGDKVHQSDENYIYNNTVYMDSAYETAIDIDGFSTHIYNNIFYAAKGNIGGKQVKMNTNGKPLSINNNIFMGDVSSKFTEHDINKVIKNPSLIQEGVSNSAGYQLTSNSPAINTGVNKIGPTIPGAGIGVFKDIEAYPTVDFYGNSVDIISGPMNIGADNSQVGINASEGLINVKGVYLNKEELSLNVEESSQLALTILPSNATNQNVIWRSKNSTIAKVDKDGFVVGRSKGTTVISATTIDGYHKVSIVVTISSEGDDIISSSKEEKLLEELIIYPNPAQNRITLSNITKPTPVIIYNINGSTTLTTSMNRVVDISHLQQGFYILKVDGYKAVRFIKN